jgi:hypothetical protein
LAAVIIVESGIASKREKSAHALGQSVFRTSAADVSVPDDRRPKTGDRNTGRSA